MRGTLSDGIGQTGRRGDALLAAGHLLTPEDAGRVGFDLVKHRVKRTGVEVVIAAPAAVAAETPLTPARSFRDEDLTCDFVIHSALAVDRFLAVKAYAGMGPLTGREIRFPKIHRRDVVLVTVAIPAGAQAASLIIQWRVAERLGSDG